MTNEELIEQLQKADPKAEAIIKFTPYGEKAVYICDIDFVEYRKSGRSIIHALQVIWKKTGEGLEYL